MAGHPAEYAQGDATLRTMAVGTLILNAFAVRAALGHFIWCRRSAIQNNVQTNTYDPRRHGATPSLLSCRRSIRFPGSRNQAPICPTTRAESAQHAANRKCSRGQIIAWSVRNANG